MGNLFCAKLCRVAILSVCGLTLSEVLPSNRGAQPLYAADTLTVYSHRHYDLDRNLFKEFEQQSGVKVSVLQAKADELIERLRAEGAKTKADLLITVSVMRLDRAVKDNLLSPIRSARIEEQVPAELRHPQNYWSALTSRARIIVYNKNLVRAAEVARYEDLSSPRWRDKLAMRSSTHVYNISLLAGMIYNNGLSGAERWVDAIATNLAYTPRGNDRDQIRAVARGNAEATIVNSYYYGILEMNEPNIVKSVAVSFPNQDGHGAHVDISGIGIIRHSKQQELATDLIEFLTSPRVQTRYAAENHEFPVNPKATTVGTTAKWSGKALDNKAVNELPNYSAAAVRLFNKSDWN